MEDYNKLLSKTIKVENKLYDEDRKFKKILSKLNENKELLFLEFLWHMRKQNISLARLNKIYFTYKKFLKEYKLKNISESEFNLIFLNILNYDCANSSKIMHLVITKQILKYFKLHKKIDLEDYKIKEERKIIRNSELLSEKDKLHILKHIKKLEHKVFFTILFDTGLRVGEVFSIDNHSFQKTKKGGYFITINESKTKLRSVFSYSNNSLIEKLLNSKWKIWNFGYRTTYNIIKRFEKKLNKRLYPHLARHSKATDLSQNLTEQELKNYMGWTPNSKMLNNYIHLNNKQVLDKIELIYGI